MIDNIAIHNINTKKRWKCMTYTNHNGNINSANAIEVNALSKLLNRKCYSRHHDMVGRYGKSVSQMTTEMFHLSQTVLGPFLMHEITGFVTRLTQRVPVVEQELPTLPEHLSSPPSFRGVRITRSLVLCVCLVDRWLSFFFWPLCCLFFDIRIRITPLVSSNSSYKPGNRICWL